jgi:serine/threonine-protein kinase
VQTWALPSQTMLSKYRLERVLGQGGFGITYLAFDTLLNRAVAIKELFPEGSSRQDLKVVPTPSLGLPGFLETKTRFLAEAQALAQFSHAGIVRVFDVFEQNATAYLVMEALEGETLGQRLIRGKLLPLEVQRLGLMLSEALSVVHSAALLHRDIKPDNVFLVSDRVVLLDFGSARAFAVDAVQQHTRLVTPGYAAPEQYASQAKFAAYTDIYGLAATLYHALEGVMPPSATDRMLGSSLRIAHQSALMSAIVQGLEIVAAKRPASAEAFAALLEKKEVSQAVQAVSSNPAIRQVVNPVPVVRPTLAQVAASMPPPPLANAARMTPIFTPTYVPVKQNSNSWVVIVITTLIILIRPSAF